MTNVNANMGIVAEIKDPHLWGSNKVHLGARFSNRDRTAYGAILQSRLELPAA